MEIIRALGEVPKSARNGDVVLGNFDGVHRGHQAVIGQAAALAENRNGPLVVVTFDPHPRVFFRPHDEPFDLTTVEQKARLLAALGVDYLVLLPFDKEFSSQPPEDFVDQVLVKGLSAKSVIVGFNFRFGHKRSGDGALLKVFGAAKGFDVTLVDAVASAGGGIYSSTHIRENLIAGKPAQAATLLGRPFEIVGTVSKGDQRGRQLGFPTANLPLSSYVQPAFGGYAVRGCGVSCGECCVMDVVPAAAKTATWPNGCCDEGVFELRRVTRLRRTCASSALAPPQQVKQPF